MEFRLDPTEEQILETTRQFARRLRERQREFEEKGVDGETLTLWEGLGLASLDLPEALGGAGLRSWLKLLCLKELAWGCAGAALYLTLPSLLLKLSTLLRDPPGELFEELRRRGRKVTLFLDEDERLKEEGGRVQGRLPFALLREPELLLLLRNEELLLLPLFQVEPCLPGGLNACGGASLTVEGEALLRIPLLREEFSRICAWIRLFQTALLCGIARASSEYARKYDLEREAFGRKIAYHQAIAFRLAEMYVSEEATELALLQAGWLFEEDPERAVTAAHQAFLFACETVLPLTITAVQLLGGHGFVRDHPVEKWMRDARAVASWLGGAVSAESFLCEQRLAELSGKEAALGGVRSGSV